MANPITEKQTDTFQDDLLSWGVSSMQGWRTTMEDAHIGQAIPTIVIEDGVGYQLPHHYLLCVLDGHGGKFAAEYVSQHLLEALCSQASFKKYARLVGTPVQKEGENKSKTKKRKLAKAKQTLPNGKHLENYQHLIQQALEDAFVEIDLQLLQEMISKRIFKSPENITKNDIVEEQADGWQMEYDDIETEQTPPVSQEPASGTTATAVLITTYFMSCANAGDSRAIFCSWQNGFVRPLSTDHKPSFPTEADRIERAGGIVNFGRVDGELAVSRALGDFEYKDYHKHATENGDCGARAVAQNLKVSPFPEVTVSEWNKDEKEDPPFLVVACDGIWDVLTNMECARLVHRLMIEIGESDLRLVAEELVDICLEKGSRDNMSLTLVRFPGGVPPPPVQGGGLARLRREQERQQQLKKRRH